MNPKENLSEIGAGMAEALQANKVADEVASQYRHKSFNPKNLPNQTTLVIRCSSEVLDPNTQLTSVAHYELRVNKITPNSWMYQLKLPDGTFAPASQESDSFGFTQGQFIAPKSGNIPKLKIDSMIVQAAEEPKPIRLITPTQIPIGYTVKCYNPKGEILSTLKRISSDVFETLTNNSSSETKETVNLSRILHWKLEVGGGNVQRITIEGSESAITKSVAIQELQPQQRIEVDSLNLNTLPLGYSLLMIDKTGKSFCIQNKSGGLEFTRFNQDNTRCLIEFTDRFGSPLTELQNISTERLKNPNTVYYKVDKSNNQSFLNPVHIFVQRDS